MSTLVLSEAIPARRLKQHSEKDYLYWLDKIWANEKAAGEWDIPPPCSVDRRTTVPCSKEECGVLDTRVFCIPWMFPVQVSDYDDGSATHTQKIYFSVHFANRLTEFWGPLAVQMLHKSRCHPLTCSCYKSNITRWITLINSISAVAHSQHTGTILPARRSAVKDQYMKIYFKIKFSNLKLHGLSLHANYTDRAAAAGRRS